MSDTLRRPVDARAAAFDEFAGAEQEHDRATNSPPRYHRAPTPERGMTTTLAVVERPPRADAGGRGRRSWQAADVARVLAPVAGAVGAGAGEWVPAWSRRRSVQSSPAWSTTVADAEAARQASEGTCRHTGGVVGRGDRGQSGHEARQCRSPGVVEADRLDVLVLHRPAIASSSVAACCSSSLPSDSNMSTLVLCSVGVNGLAWPSPRRRRARVSPDGRDAR